MVRLSFRLCFLHPFPKTNEYFPPARAATPLGCRPLSFVYQAFQVFWQDDVFVDLGSAVQVIYLMRNAESRYFQCVLGLSCVWPRHCFCRRSGASDDLLPWYDKAFAIFFLLVRWNMFWKLQGELRRTTSTEQIPAINLQPQLPILYTDYESIWVILTRLDSSLPVTVVHGNVLQRSFQKYLIMILPQALPCLPLREVLGFWN